MEKIGKFVKGLNFLEVLVIFIIVVVMWFLVIKLNAVLSYDQEKTIQENIQKNIQPALRATNTPESSSYSILSEKGEEDSRVPYNMTHTRHPAKTTTPVSRKPLNPVNDCNFLKDIDVLECLLALQAKTDMRINQKIVQLLNKKTLENLDAVKAILKNHQPSEETRNLVSIFKKQAWVLGQENQAILNELRSGTVVTPERAEGLYNLAPFGSDARLRAEELAESLKIAQYAK